MGLNHFRAKTGKSCELTVSAFPLNLFSKLHGDCDHRRAGTCSMTCPSQDKKSRKGSLYQAGEGPRSNAIFKELVTCRRRAAWDFPRRHQDHSFSRHCRHVFDSWHCRHCEFRISREVTRTSGVTLRLGKYANAPWNTVHQTGQRDIISSDGDNI